MSEATLASNAELLELVEGLQDYAIFVLSSDGFVLTWNAGAERAKGYCSEEILGRHFSVFYSADDVAAAHPADVLRQAREQGVYTEEGWRFRKNGSRFWARVTVTALRDSRGNVRCFGKVTQDLTERRAAQAKLERATKQQNDELRGLAEGVLLFDVEPGGSTRLVLANQSARDLFGLDESTLQAMDAGRATRLTLCDAAGAPMDRVKMPFAVTALTGRGVRDFVWGWTRPENPTRWFTSSSQPILDEAGELTSVVLSIVDVSERYDSHRRLEAAHARFAALVEHSSDVVCILDPDGTIQYASPAYAAVYRQQPQAAVGSSLFARFHPDDRQRFADELAHLERDPTRVATVETRVQANDHTIRHLEITATNRLSDPAVMGIVINSRDVTERVETATRLAHEAMHDSLTGLANRALLLDRLTHALSRRRSQRRKIGLLFLDLDHFKRINDSLGHGAGDQVLTVVASRLVGAVRPEDTVSRLGGDEFVILADDMPDEATASTIAERVRAAVSEPVEVAGREITVACSIGVSLADGSPAELLLQQADTAMYRVKTSGRGRWEMYDQAMRVGAQRRLDIEALVRNAIGTPDIVLRYQPIIDLGTGQPVGSEALVRLATPDGALLPPDEFIPVAEDTGLILGLGLDVLGAACTQQGLWSQQGSALSRVSINVSARQLRSPTLIADVEHALDRAHADPSTVCLELTESSLLLADRSTRSAVHELARLGVGIALDDFGTGMSSLAHLRSFPITVIKIDRSFISGLGTNDGDTELVKALITLGAALHLAVVAEGVETEQQEQLLQRFGCRFAQGYRYSRPAPADELTQWARDRRLQLS